MNMLADQVDAVIGVDTHKSSHTAAVVEPTGGVVAHLTMQSDAFGAKRVLAFAKLHGPGRRVWAIEDTGSYGSGLTTYLLEQGEWVVEIDRPARPARRNGAKSDELDAVRAAREALSREHLAQPRRRGEREAMRVLLVTRQGAVLSRTRAITSLHALVVNAPEGIRNQLRHLDSDDLLARCARLRTGPSQSTEHRATITALRSTARRALACEAEAAGPGVSARASCEAGGAGAPRRTRPRGHLRGGHPQRLVASRSDPHRSGLRDARGCRAHPGLVGPDRPLPPQPCRRPSVEPGPAHDRPLTPHPPPRDEGLRRPSLGRGKDAPRDQAMSQASSRPASLRTPRASGGGRLTNEVAA